MIRGSDVTGLKFPGFGRAGLIQNHFPLLATCVHSLLDNFISNTINYRLFTLKSQPEEYKVYHFEGFDLFLMSISFLHSMPHEYKQYGMG